MAKDVKFSVIFEGSSVEEGSIDVADLAPALLSLNEILIESNRIIGNEFNISLNVKNVHKGSFEVDLFVAATSIMDHITQMFNSDEVNALKNLLEILGIGSGGLYGLLKLILKSKGKKPNQIRFVKNNNTVDFIYDDQTLIAPAGTEKVFANRSIRQHLELFFKPLSKNGISKIKFKKENESIEISDSEKDYYIIPEDTEEVLIDKIDEKVYKIVSLSFKEDNKWRLNDGNNTFNVIIKDDNFLKKIEDNHESFVKGSLLRVDIRTLQKIKGIELITTYEVLKVIEHIKPLEQISIFDIEHEE